MRQACVSGYFNLITTEEYELAVSHQAVRINHGLLGSKSSMTNETRTIKSTDHNL